MAILPVHMSHVVLSVGGARGAYQAKVLRDLSQEGQPMTSFYGSSVGALNAAMMATGQVHALVRLWSAITNEMVYNRKVNALGVARALVSNKAILDLSPLRQLIYDHLIGYRLKYDLTVEYVDYSHKLITHKMAAGNRLMGDDLNKIYHSCAIPVIFPTEQYADGGLMQPVPLSPAIEDAKPGDTIIVISCHPFSFYPIAKPKNNIEKAETAFEIMQSALVRSSLQPFLTINAMLKEMRLDEWRQFKRFDDAIYAPSEPLDWGMLDFDAASKYMREI